MTTLLQHAHSCGESINHIRQPTPYEQHVGARLLDFFSSRALWNRSLWTVGVVLALEEVLEASVAQRDSHLGPPTMQEVTATAARLAEHDPGLGTQAFRNTLRGILLTNGAPRKELRFGGLDYATVQQINQEIQREYLDRWAAAITMPNPPRPERTARAIGSHMLDAGFFPDFLHRWWTLKLRYEQDTEKSLGDIVREASALVAIPAKHFKVLVTFHSPLQPSMKGVRPPSNWLTGEHVSKWLTEKQFDSHGLKQQGGLLLEVNAREPESAVQAALERTELFAARVLVTLRKEVRHLPYAWVEGGGRHPLQRRVRGLKIGAMQRENRVWLESDPDGVIDPALELLAPLQLGSSSAAIAGGWAAIEALLSEPDNRVAAADRLAAIVACAFPRAELTEFSYAFEKENDELARELEQVNTNRDRSMIIAQAILENRIPNLTDSSHMAAVERLRSLLRDPYSKLNDIQMHVKDSFNRLYRLRNLVLHAGLTNAIGLSAALRTATPLVSAGIDRIAHFRYIGGIHPIELAARARIALATVSPSRPLGCLDLLGV